MPAPISLPLTIKTHREGIYIQDAQDRLVALITYDDGCSVRRDVRKVFTKAEAIELARTMARAVTAEAEKG